MGNPTWGDIGQGTPYKGWGDDDEVYKSKPSQPTSNLNNVTDGAGAASSSGGSGGSSGGSSSGSSSSSKSSDDDAEKAAKRAAEKAEKRAREAIGNQYSAVQKGLEQLLGYLPGQQSASMNKYKTQRDYSRGQAQDALTKAMGRFSGYENDIMEGQKGTLRDLSSDVRNAFQAGNIYLGAKGASNSSAAGMYSRGIQQAANRNRGDVMRQTQGNLNDLNIRRSEAEAATQSQYDAIDNWFNTAVSDLETQFNERRQQIEMAKVNATADEQAALAALDTELWRSAQNLYNQLAAQQDEYLKSVNDSISSGQGLGNGFDIDTSKTYGDPSISPIDSKIETTGRGQIQDVYNPLGKKRWEDVGLGIGAATPNSGFQPGQPIFG